MIIHIQIIQIVIKIIIIKNSNNINIIKIHILNITLISSNKIFIRNHQKINIKINIKINNNNHLVF